MQLITEIQVPSDKEERENWSKMRTELMRVIFDLTISKGRECDCPCGRDFYAHLRDLEHNSQFRKHFLMMALVLSNHPELTSSFIQAACLKLTNTDWLSIEDIATHLQHKKNFV